MQNLFLPLRFFSMWDQFGRNILKGLQTQTRIGVEMQLNIFLKGTKILNDQDQVTPSVYNVIVPQCNLPLPL